jgi:CPA2 family monovalent cation:H+ antiporter-2
VEQFGDDSRCGGFVLVLARVGRSSGAISDDVYMLTLNTASVMMALTPVLSGLVLVGCGRLGPRRDREAYEATNLPTSGLSDHVVIAGSWRVGRGIDDALSHLALPFVLIESADRRAQRHAPPADDLWRRQPVSESRK